MDVLTAVGIVVGIVVGVVGLLIGYDQLKYRRMGTAQERNQRFEQAFDDIADVKSKVDMWLADVEPGDIGTLSDDRPSDAPAHCTGPADRPDGTPRRSRPMTAIEPTERYG